jgi:4-hydroxy-2-oxoglutarate aldolase
VTALPRGIVPPIVTPFRDGRFDPEAFRFNIERWNGTALAGYLAVGSNGEGVYLSDDEIARVVEAAAEHRAAGKCVLAGTGRESTRRTIDLTRLAARAGAEAALVVPPSYYRAWMTESALERHYRSVADASEIPIILYHVPKFSPVTFSARLVLALAQHPNIQGIKETSGDMTLLSTVLKDRPASFRVYVGSGSLLLAGILLGADGGIVALANVAPGHCVEIQRLAEAGRIAEAREIQFRLLPVNQAVTGTHGIAGLKHAMDLLGYRGGPPCPPLEPLGSDAEKAIAAVLADAGLEGEAG